MIRACFGLGMGLAFLTLTLLLILILTLILTLTLILIFLSAAIDACKRLESLPSQLRNIQKQQVTLRLRLRVRGVNPILTSNRTLLIYQVLTKPYL
jgi:hypothetical protein